MSFPIGKDWWKSRTIWLAVIQFAIGGMVALQANSPEFASVGWFAMAKSILDLMLRFLTTQAVR